MTDSRYIVGIDLGTTNCALTYVDLAAAAADSGVRVLPIPQLIAPGELQALDLLPSFIYLPEAHEVAPGALSLPWSPGQPDLAVGAYAREMAAKVPGKVVASAKSWLCVEGVDGHAENLPYHRGEVPRQLSPVGATRLLLEHLRQAWDHAMAKDRPEYALSQQSVLLTVPASFDAMARELTAQAAAEAGLNVHLLEEPLAAFYAWLHDHQADWREFVSEGDILLVCDIGGGTTDFTLILVTAEDGNLGLERIAVGDHILLGGDNMDLALAYRLAARFQSEQGTTLDGSQLAALTHVCRTAKERLGGEGQAGPQKLTILGRGTGVVAGSLSIELTAEEMNDCLLDGFFPVCDIDSVATERRRVGLRSFGLDYASDPAVTKHVAGFLGTHSFRDAAGRPLLPAAVLFNGGVTKSEAFRRRTMDALAHWGEESGQSPAVLEESDPDLAVATGAAWYGAIQREGGVRIKSGSARSYYVGVESSLPAVPGFEPPMEALCVVPFGMEEGTSAVVPVEGLGLVVGELTEFRFFSSTCRQEDQVGQVLPQWNPEEVAELPPLVVELPIEESGVDPIGTMVPVSLEVVLTEVGTLQVWCLDTRGEGRWKLEFEVRSRQDVS